MAGKTNDAQNTYQEPFIITVGYTAACATTTLNPFTVPDIQLVYSLSTPHEEDLTVPGDSLADLADPFFEMCGTRTVTLIDMATNQQPTFANVMIDNYVDPWLATLSIYAPGDPLSIGQH